MRTISCCNKLPGEVVDSPTLDTKDLAGQDAGSSWLNSVFAKKIGTDEPCAPFSTFHSVILWSLADKDTGLN